MTTWDPVASPISEGVLPTYLPSTVISAPAGVDVKLHFTVCRTLAAATGATAVGALFSAGTGGG